MLQARQIESNFIIFFIVLQYLEIKIDTYAIDFNQGIGADIVSKTFRVENVERWEGQQVVSIEWKSETTGTDSF